MGQRECGPEAGEGPRGDPEGDVARRQQYAHQVLARLELLHGHAARQGRQRRDPQAHTCEERAGVAQGGRDPR